MDYSFLGHKFSNFNCKPVLFVHKKQQEEFINFINVYYEMNIKF